MKIRSKLLILNIIVNLSAMVLLGFLITFIVSNYIEDSLSKEVRIQNVFEMSSLRKTIQYDKLYEEYIKKMTGIGEDKDFSDLKVMTLIVEMKEKRIIKATEKIARKQFSEKIQLKSGDEFEVLGDAINTMAQSLEARDIEQKRFYETVSHDIKTPLTVISGYAQGLKTDIFNDRDTTLDKIIEECQELKKQLENVIFLSKLDTVKESYKFEQLEMNRLIIESLNNVESLIILNEIDVDYSPSKVIFFKGDRQKLIKVEKKKEQVCVTIKDNGPGFSDEILENSFSRDYIGEKGGTGIGLSIIKRVVEGHHAILTLKNDAQQGAVYLIQLPL